MRGLKGFYFLLFLFFGKNEIREEESKGKHSYGVAPLTILSY